MRLEGRKALVTGGNRGLGRAIALGLAGEGADVALTFAHHEDEAQAVKEAIAASGRQAVALRMNLADSSEVEATVAKVIGELGYLDILVNNAGVIVEKPFLETTDSDYERIMSVNVRGAFVCSRAAAGHMAARRYGKIVNVSSAGYVRAGAGAAVYGASKGALTTLTRGMAFDLASYGINVNAIAPGPHETALSRALFENPDALKQRLARIPLGRIGQPEDIVGAVVLLCSDQASFMTGSVIFIDGGQTMG